MISCHKWPIGICGWSLKNDIPVLSQLMNATGITHLHLSLDPDFSSDNRDYLDAIERYQWEPTATMIGFDQEDYTTLETIKQTGGIVPDQYWGKNKQKVLHAIELTASLKLKYLTFHFGFIDNTKPKLKERVRFLADAAQGKNVMILMETGQENAETLMAFLTEISHPALGVNFDPANMILYGKGDPVQGLEILAQWVKHVHIKDAQRSPISGEWGTEVPWGEGDFDNNEFLNTLKRIGYQGALAIEREAGSTRMKDIQNTAATLLQFSD
jgi:sugar phosphate isomerase/epimerase